MKVDRWAYVEAIRFVACCFGVGAVLGFISALVQPKRRVHLRDQRRRAPLSP